MGTQKITEKQSKPSSEIEVNLVKEKNSDWRRRVRKIYQEICALEMHTLGENC